jgi:hypothetical protein
MLVLQIASGVVLGFFVLQWIGICDAGCNPKMGGGSEGEPIFWVSMIAVAAVILWVSGAGPMALEYARTFPHY